MKTIYWVLIIIAGTLFPLIFMIVVPIAILNMSWWWFFGTLILESFVGAVVGITFLIIKLRAKEKIKEELDIEDAKKNAIHQMKYDEDNPDNLQIIQQRTIRVGAKGSPKTPLLVLEGIGTENNDKRVAIINMNNPRKEINVLIDPTETELNEKIRMSAENPEEEIKEEKTMSMDEFGRPITTIRSRRPSDVIEARKEKEKTEADEKNII